MSRRLLALNLLVALAALFFSVQLVRTLEAPRILPPLPAPTRIQSGPPPAGEKSPTQPALGTYGAVASRTLFNPSRAEAVAGSTPLAPTARPILHGVVIDEETRLAYLEDPASKRVFGYKTGDTVAGGQLERIEADRVIIKRPEGSLEVKLKDPDKPKPVVRAAPAPPAPPTARAPGFPPRPAVSPTVPAIPGAQAPIVPRPPSLLRRPPVPPATGGQTAPSQ